MAFGDFFVLTIMAIFLYGVGLYLHDRRGK